MQVPERSAGRNVRWAYFFAARSVGVFLAAALVSAAGPARRAPVAPASADLVPVVGVSLKNDVSAPLAALAAMAAQAAAEATPAEIGAPLFVQEINRLLPNRIADPLYLAQLTAQGIDYSAVNDPVIQRAPLAGAAAMPAPLHNFDGIANSNNLTPAVPPDTNGDIGYDPATGTRYYMQWVNLSFAVWEVDAAGTATQVVAPTAGNALWAGFGDASDPCRTENDGDPIILFDPIEKRWLASQFAVPGPYFQCIAVSTSADPTGSWYRYKFQISATKFNDYAKFGVWPDGYYMSINQFIGNAWAGAAAIVFERDQMLQGLPARFVTFDLFSANQAFGGQLPSDLDGSDPPPVGAPNYFVEADDHDTTAALGTFDAIRIWKFHVDWTNVANSTFGANGQPNSIVPIADFTLLPCVVSGSRGCIPQSSTMVKLDGLGDRLMHRAAYRNFGDHEVLLFNHTANVVSPGSRAGIRWYELRDPGGTPSLFQQGTYSPDTLDRWMGSIAMDRIGNIALGYSASSSGVFPSIRYAGRLAGDTITGTLTLTEGTLRAGGGSQTSSSSRWGDYSMLAVDPFDDCTFWFTNEYYLTTSQANWRTRIGSFRFPSCSSAALGQLSGVVSDAVTHQPLSGAVVSTSSAPAQSVSTLTDSGGHYGFQVAEGVYTITVSATAHFPGVVSNVQVNANGLTTRDVALVPWPFKHYLPFIGK